jgi:hypothetical protein
MTDKMTRILIVGLSGYNSYELKTVFYCPFFDILCKVDDVLSVLHTIFQALKPDKLMEKNLDS